MSKVLVIDIGTTRLKIACVDETGEIRNIVSSALPRKSPTEQSAECWFSETLRLIPELIDLESNNNFDAIALTGNMHALLTIDRNGEPIFDAWLWNDLRASKECEFLNREYRDVISEKFFNPAIPGFPLPKLLHLKNTEPSIFKSVWKILQPKDFIAFKLCREVFTDFTDASGTLMFNLTSKSWDKEFLAELGLSVSVLPDVVNSYEKIGNLREDIARITGLKPGIPVVIGAGDLATAALGSKVDNNTFVLVLGTAGQLLTTDSKLLDKLRGKIFTFLFVDLENYFYLGTVPAGGYSFDWFSRILTRDTSEVFKLAGESKEDMNLLYLPFIQGTGTPHMIYEPLGAFLNISDQDSEAEFCRALIEGAIFSLKESSNVIEAFTEEKDNLVLQSLAAKVPIIQDIALSLYESRNIYVSDQKEASIVGAAIVGTVGCGIYNDIRQAQANMVKVSKLNALNKGGESKILKRFEMFRNLSKILLTGRDR